MCEPGTLSSHLPVRLSRFRGPFRADARPGLPDILMMGRGGRYTSRAEGSVFAARLDRMDKAVSRTATEFLAREWTGQVHLSVVPKPGAMNVAGRESDGGYCR